METKCPICGAPLADGKCGYCGCTARGIDQERENVNSDFRQTEKEQRQQGDVVGGSMLNNMGIVPGISRKSKTTTLLLCILQSADSTRRFCGAKRTRCGASGLN